MGKRRFSRMLALLAAVVFCCLPAFAAGEAEGKGWEVIQYADASGNVGLFYSLRNLEDGTVILLDSGNPGNTDKARQAIAGLGGRVDAWFLTHYHPDHIGAFNALWEEMKDKIGRIYVTPMDYETYEPIAHEWDNPATFAEFLEKTKDFPEVTALHRGEELEIDGLKIRVFNAYDEKVNELSTDWCNDCSLVLRMAAEEESILFLADLSRAGKPLGQYILDTFGAENVRAEYVQAGHHGNWGLGIEFYEQIKPKELLFNAPDWVMTGETYDAKDLEAWCREQGIATHDYRQGDYRFILK